MSNSRQPHDDAPASARLSRRALLCTPLVAGTSALWLPRRARTAETYGPVVNIAAADATDEEKAAAHYICPGVDDHLVIQPIVHTMPWDGGTLNLSSGTFDFGQGDVKIQHRYNVWILGQGIDITFVRNAPTADEDLEPFNYSDADGAVVRDMTIHADGSPRLTSDALDFDNSDNVTVERVKITKSRGRGIVFDGKDQPGQPGWQSVGHLVRDCEITGCARSGIEFLCAENSQIINCIAYGNGESGVNIASQSDTERKARHNTVSGGHFYANAKYGVAVWGCDFNTITGVTCTDNLLDGIRVATKPNTDKMAVGNQIINCVSTNTQKEMPQAWGINLHGSTDDHVSDTIIRDCDLRGNRLGPYKLNAIKTVFNDNLAQGTTPTRLVLDKAKSKYNGAITATVSGFGEYATVSLLWPDDTLLAKIRLDGAGNGSALFRTPLAPLGDHVVRATDEEGNLATDVLRVIPRIALSQESGQAGETIRITMYGFASGEQVDIQWSTDADSDFDTLATVTIAEDGRGSAKVTIPPEATIGNHTFRSQNSGDSHSVKARFNVTGTSPAASPAASPVAQE
jgi:hypothetical protein